MLDVINALLMALLVLVCWPKNEGPRCWCTARMKSCGSCPGWVCPRCARHLP